MERDRKKKRPESGQSGDGAPREKSASREILEWVFSLGLALGAALLIKYFIADVYSIPSGSMEPTLHGVTYGGDRVFCSKLNYHFRESAGPRRWEIFVFKYPGGNPGDRYYGENFIKRCVGLPGESVYFRAGDLYVAGPADLKPKIARKPETLQQQIWIPVYREDFSRANAAALDHNWRRFGSGGKWTISNGALRGETQKAIHLAFRSMAAGNELPGITDRHVKRQAVTFKCPACGGKLRKTVRSQQLTGYCPACGEFLTESDILPNYRVYACPKCSQTTRRVFHGSLHKADAYCETCMETGPPRYLGVEWNFPASGLPGQKARSMESSDGIKEGRTGPQHIVQDLRFSCAVTPRSKEGELRAELSADDEQWRVVLRFGATGRVRLLHNGTPVKAADRPFGLESGKKVSLSFERWDRTIRVRLATPEGASCEILHRIDGALPSAGYETGKSGVLLSLAGGEAELDDFSIDRDVQYYFPEHLLRGDSMATGMAWTPGESWDYPQERLWEKMVRERMYVLPEDGFMACGDNQPTSNDSRNWGPVPRENLIGPALLIWWPPHRIRILE